MSRQEDFIEAGIAYRMEHGKPMCIAGSNLADAEREMNRAELFEAGAEYGYQYAVDKTCKWIRLHIGVDMPVRFNPDGEPLAEDFFNKVAARCKVADKVVEQFKRAMEE